jgi:hypothetical protein
MKSLSLNTYDVREMSQQEMLNEYGGSFIGGIIAGLVLTFLWDTFDDPESAGKAISAGKEKAFNQF